MGKEGKERKRKKEVKRVLLNEHYSAVDITNSFIYVGATFSRRAWHSFSTCLKIPLNAAKVSSELSSSSFCVGDETNHVYPPF